MTALLLALAAGKGPPVIIAKSDGREVRGELLSFERGRYKILTEAGKELEITATEVDLVRFPQRVENLPMPPTPPMPPMPPMPPAEDETPRRRALPEEPARLDRLLRKLKEEGTLDEFVKREEKALRDSGNVREAMWHLTRLRQAAVAEYGRGSRGIVQRMREHIAVIEDPKLRDELKNRIRFWGLRRPGGPFRRKPPR